MQIIYIAQITCDRVLNAKRSLRRDGGGLFDIVKRNRPGRRHGCENEPNRVLVKTNPTGFLQRSQRLGL
jgi:hypothetical protein